MVYVNVIQNGHLEYELGCDHRPVTVKKAVIGSKGGRKLTAECLSCKVFRDWSIINLQERNHIY